MVAYMVKVLEGKSRSNNDNYTKSPKQIPLNALLSREESTETLQAQQPRRAALVASL
jgi:hypothetical protein